MRWTVIQTAFLGDVVLTLPLLDAIATLSPRTEIQFITRPEAVNVIETHPAVVQAISYDKRKKDSGIGGWIRMLNRIRDFAPEIVIVPHRSLRSVALASLSKAKTRIGYDRAAKFPGLTHRIRYRADAHETARLLDLLQPINSKPGIATIPSIQLTDADHQVALQLLNSDRKRIAIAPGAVWMTKRYPADRFKQVAKILADKGYQIIAIGGPADRELCEEVAKVGSGISCAGNLSPRESAAVIQLCDLLITNDSAPLHLAQGVGTRTLAIFGATVPAFGFGPQGINDKVLGIELECRPCAIHGGNQCPKGHFKCMLELSPETVAATALSMISA